MSDTRDVEFDGAPKPETLDGCFVRVSPLSGRPLYPHRLSRCFVSHRSPSVSLSQICPRRFRKAAQTGRLHSPVKVGKRSGTAAVGDGSCVPSVRSSLARSSPLPIEWKPRRAVLFSPVLVPVPVPPSVRVRVWWVCGGRFYRPTAAVTIPSKLSLVKGIYLKRQSRIMRARAPYPQIANHFKIAPKIADFIPPR